MQKKEFSNSILMTSSKFSTKVRLGDHTLSTDPDCSPSGFCAPSYQEFKIIKAIPHRDYGSNFENDIALLVLDKPAKETGNEMLDYLNNFWAACPIWLSLFFSIF